MELSTLLGIVLAIAFLIIGIFWGGGQIGQFIDPASVMITFGGALAGLMAAFSMKDFLNIPKLIGVSLKKKSFDAVGGITTIVGLANTARKEGMLALEEQIKGLDDEFLQKGIMLVVDGTDPELVKNIMEAEISSIENRHKKGVSIMDMLGAFGPAFGMLGTLIGLIIMLGDLDDPSTLGAGMSAALITTFYGSFLANVIAIPVASKLKTVSGQEILYKEILLEGLLSIQAGENPRIIEEKLYSFLPRSAKPATADKAE